MGKMSTNRPLHCPTRELPKKKEFVPGKLLFLSLLFFLFPFCVPFSKLLSFYESTVL